MFTPSSVAIVVLISCREGLYGLLMIVNARKFGMVKNIGITIKEMDNIIGRRETESARYFFVHQKIYHWLNMKI